MKYHIITPSPTVLVVSDSATHRRQIDRQLRNQEYQVLSAHRVAAVVLPKGAPPPDLVILDVTSLDEAPACAINRLKAAPGLGELPLLVLGVEREMAFSADFPDIMADDFIPAPWQTEELWFRVWNLVQLARRRTREAAEHNSIQLLYDISRHVTTHLNLDQLLSSIVGITRTALSADKASIILVDRAGKVLQNITARADGGISSAKRIAHMVLEQGFAGWVMRTGEGAIIRNTTTDDRWLPIPEDDEVTGSAIGTPLTDARGQMMGALIVTHRQPARFLPRHLELLGTIAAQVTGALQNARLFAEVDSERRKLSAVLTLSPEAIVLLDDQLQVLLFNAAAEVMFNLDKEAVIGRNANIIPAFRPLITLIEANMTSSEEVLLDDGRILAVNLAPIPGGESLALFQDITGRALAEARRIEQERQEKKALQEIFGRYVSPSLVEQTLNNTQGEAFDISRQQRRWAVILFADLRNHSRMISTLPSEQALELLNDFFENMTEITSRFEGTIVDLIGDELEVGFNLTSEQPDAAQRALRTAIEMQRRFNQLRPRWYQRTSTNLGLGIGIDHGDVVLGNVGSKTRINLALVGKAVNVAHRLVDLAEDGQIVLSADFHQLISADLWRYPVAFEPEGGVHLKGFDEPITLYRARMRREHFLLTPPAPSEAA
jgi:class 3 adenylate cyclase/PAS domain-containing protein